MLNFWQIVLLFSSKKRWRLGRKLKRLKRELEISPTWKREMKRKFKRKSSISNWKMSKKDTCLRITIWSLSRDTRKKEKYKMLFCFKRKKKLNNQRWLNNKMNKEKDKICLELSKRTKWRIKLDFNLRDLLQWKWRRREDANKLEPKENIWTNVERKKIWEIWKWMRFLKWRNLRWNL